MRWQRYEQMRESDGLIFERTYIRIRIQPYRSSDINSAALKGQNVNVDMILVI